MMKRLISILLILFSTVLATTFFGCGGDENKNAEADILSFSLKEKEVLEGGVTIKGTEITVIVKKGTDITRLTPVISLSEGATVNPASETIQDFSFPVKYTVVSQDKTVRRVYTVTVSYPLSVKTFSFETWRAVHNYEEPVETDASGNIISYWGTSNAGFRIFNLSVSAEQFPLIQGSGYKNKGVSLITRKGINMGSISVPLVAGSLFSGVMETSMVAVDPLRATKFGQPVTEEPYEVRGFYRYKSGTQKTDKKGNPIDGKDMGTIAVIFYEADGNFMLDGTNLYTHDAIIAKASFHPEDVGRDSFQEFVLSLEKVKEATIDFSQHQYRLALVFSSSAEGDRYIGAVGSCLEVDEVEVLVR